MIINWKWDGKLNRIRFAIYLIALTAIYVFLFKLSCHYDKNFLESYFQVFLCSIVFIYLGILFTVQRLNDAGYSILFLFYFFVPVLNIIYFLILCCLPSDQNSSLSKNLVNEPTQPINTDFESLEERKKNSVRRIGSALIASVVAALIVLASVALASFGFSEYGFVLFFCSPFCQGLVAVLIYSYSARRSFRSCIRVILLSLLIATIALLCFALEGVICIAMASPLILMMAMLGGYLGFAIQEKRWNLKSNILIIFVVLLSLPILMGMERYQDATPPIFQVQTSIEIEATPSIVWHNVVTFADIEVPNEWIFKTGLAYPTHATIEGTGVGSMRRCVFTTGEFLEPIEIWDEPKLLRFSVKSNPAPMHEQNPFKEIHPPHLDGYFISRQGQFQLTPTPSGGTLLTGTTWYEHGLWPAIYWQLWSDYIIHQIHYRVLKHIKKKSELNK